MLSLQDAKNRFSAVVEAALSGQPQRVSRRGKPAMVVISVSEYDRLVAAAKEKRESFANHLMAFPEVDLPNRAQIRPRDVDF